MTPQRVTLITLGVADLERSKAFYAAQGWEVTREMPGSVVFYQLHGCALGLFGLDPLAAEQGRDRAELGTGAMTLARNVESRAEVDAEYARAIAAGARAITPPFETDWGGYSSYHADPDGHVWEIAHNPFWPLEADGSLILPEGEDD